MTRELFQLGMRSHPFLAIAAIVAIASSAHADDADDLKRQGLKAAQDKNWELARELFQRSYERDPRPLTLFNLAVAQEHTDKLVEASASYTAFLAQPSTPDTEPFRRLARTALPALEQAIPTLTIHATGVAAGDAIELDGRPASIVASIPLDPGSHIVVVRRGGVAVAERSVALARSARDTVDLVVPVPLVPSPRPPRPPPDAEPATASIALQRSPAAPAPKSLLRSGWFWGITAVVVVGAAGAGYYYLNVPNREPTRGTFGPPVPVP